MAKALSLPKRQRTSPSGLDFKVGRTVQIFNARAAKAAALVRQKNAHPVS